MSDYNDEHNDHAGQIPAAPTSGLAALRQQRQKIQQALHLDLRVPRYEEPVFVRYSAPTRAQLTKVQDRVSKSRDGELLGEALLLAECCVGVFQKDANGEPIGTPEEWPKFDKDLAAYLGEPDLSRAADIVRALFFTDGDIISTAATINRWAGYAAEQAVEEFEGN